MADSTSCHEPKDMSAINILDKNYYLTDKKIMHEITQTFWSLLQIVFMQVMTVKQILMLKHKLQLE